jgi:hypothetical protein
VRAGGVGETCADGVLEHVLDRGREVAVAFDDPRREAVAEEVAPALVPAVERLGVRAVQALEAVRQAPELGLDDEVVVVRHQRERMDAPVVPLDLACEEAQEAAVVVYVSEGRGARDASRGDVVDALRRELVARSPHAFDASGRLRPIRSEQTGGAEVVTLS